MIRGYNVQSNCPVAPSLGGGYHNWQQVVAAKEKRSESGTHHHSRGSHSSQMHLWDRQGCRVASLPRSTQPHTHTLPKWEHIEHVNESCCPFLSAAGLQSAGAEVHLNTANSLEFSSIITEANYIHYPIFN